MKYQDEIERSQEIYSKLGLAFYKVAVLGISNQFIWKCPTKTLVNLYNENITQNHLDVGVGTGDIP
ncbi:MAG: methyltransferase type 12, partial [Candidatus Pacearchaeota archaeon]|nr:methyltransferase type 12 [Candidatus Pacearchaeota archaeon]